MAFVSTPLATRSAFTRPAVSGFSGRAVAARTARTARTHVTTPRMETDWTGPAPPSSVLGIGAGTSSSVFIAGSVMAFALGAYCVYMSNLFSPLGAESVNAVYVIGSLGLPISWGCHVAGWIQKKNGK